MPGQAAEDTGPTRGELAAARKLIEKTYQAGTWSAHPRAPEKFDWPAWCVNARYDGEHETTVIPEIGEDAAKAITAAMNWILPLMAERDLLLLAMERIMLGKAPTAEERDVALGPAGPLDDVEYPTSAGIIAAAAPELVRRMRARGEGR